MAPELMEFLNKSTFSKGHSFLNNHQENKVIIDKELENLFDEKTKSIIENLFASKVNDN